MPQIPSRRATVQAFRKATATATMLILLTTGCTEDKERPMMSYQQASETVERLIQEITAVLRPAPRLEQFSNLGSVPCSGPNDDQETGNVMVEHTYWLRDVPPALNDDIIEQAQQHWSTNGYQTTRESGTIGSNDYKLVVTHPDNGFRVSIGKNDGFLAMRAQSTCVRRPKD